MQTQWTINPDELENICSVNIGKSIDEKVVSMMAEEITKEIDQEIIKRMIDIIGAEQFPTVELREGGSIHNVSLSYPAGTIGFRNDETVKVWSRTKYMEEFTFKGQMSLKDFMQEYFADLIV